MADVGKTSVTNQTIHFNMVKSLRNIAIIGEGVNTNFNQKYAELEKESPTEAVIIDQDGIVNSYSYVGYAFMNENWFEKYNKDAQNDTSAIDRLLVNLVKAADGNAHSANLTKIKDYLANPPESLEESVRIWKSFYDPEFKEI
jgi:hypothetical protein